MFSFFKKRNTEAQVRDKIWITEKAKFGDILRRLKEDGELIVVGWQMQTIDRLLAFPGGEEFSGRILPAMQMNKGISQNGKLLFAEHHTSAEREQDLFRKLELTTVEVYTSLDEKLLAPLVQENFKAILDRLGLKENECIEHQMLSSAIRKAQDKYTELNPLH